MLRRRARQPREHGADFRLGHLRLARQRFDLVQRQVLRGFGFGGEHRQPLQVGQRRAAAQQHTAPVDAVEPAQRRDGVAHALVVFGLLLLLALQCAGGVGQVRGQPTADVGADVGRKFIAAPLQLQREGFEHASLLQRVADLCQPLHVAGRGCAFDPAVRGILRSLARGGAFGQAAQVFHQHHAQRGRDGP